MKNIYSWEALISRESLAFVTFIGTGLFTALEGTIAYQLLPAISSSTLSSHPGRKQASPAIISSLRLAVLNSQAFSHLLLTSFIA
jgi:hypothetical protein